MTHISTSVRGQFDAFLRTDETSDHDERPQRSCNHILSFFTPFGL